MPCSPPAELCGRIDQNGGREYHAADLVAHYVAGCEVGLAGVGRAKGCNEAVGAVGWDGGEIEELSGVSGLFYCRH